MRPPRKVTARPITAPQFFRQHILRMTVSELAAALQISGPVVTQCEIRGKFPMRHYETLIRMAKERGRKIKLSWLERVPWADDVPSD